MRNNQTPKHNPNFLAPKPPVVRRGNSPKGLKLQKKQSDGASSKIQISSFEGSLMSSRCDESNFRDQWQNVVINKQKNSNDET